MRQPYIESATALSDSSNVLLAGIYLKVTINCGY